jgi:hypothetical protein
VLQEVEEKLNYIIEEIKQLTQEEGEAKKVVQDIRSRLSIVMSLPLLEKESNKDTREAIEYLLSQLNSSPQVWGSLLTWVFIHALGKIADPGDYQEISRSWIDEWMLGKIIASALQDMQVDQGAAWRAVSLVKILTGQHDWCEIGENGSDSPYQVLQVWLKDEEVHRYLGVNRYQDILWFNKESFGELLWWMYIVGVVHAMEETSDIENPDLTNTAPILDCYQVIKVIQKAAEASGYQLEGLLSGIKT